MHPRPYPSGQVPDDCPLSRRQYQVLVAMADGLTYQEAAEKLGLSPKTVRTHLDHARRRLNVGSTHEAIAAMYNRGWRHAPLTVAQREHDPANGDRSLQQDHPFLAAYLHHFDQWLASGQQNTRARHLMDVALYGAQKASKENQ